MKYKVHFTPRGAVATVLIPTNRGTLRIRATALFAEVRKAAQRLASRRPQVGSFFGSLGRSVRRLAKSKALRKAFRTVKKVAQHPAFQAGVTAFAPGIGLGLVASLKAVEAGEKLIQAANSGQPGDRRRVLARATIKAATYAADREAKLGKRLPGMTLPGLQGVPPQLQAALSRYLGAVVPA